MNQVLSRPAARSAADSLARVGFAGRGAMYLIVGWLALQAAAGVANSAIADKQQALQTVGQEPLGTFLLIVLAGGLLAYALWSLVRAVFDPERRGHEPQVVFTRVGEVFAAVSYGALGLGAARLALGLGQMSKDSDQSTQDWTARLLEAPFGVPLAVATGLIILVVAAIEFVRAYQAHFQKDLGNLRGTERLWLIRFGRAGLTARGIVFTLTGVFLIQAARHDDPTQAVGLGGALAKLAEQSQGPLLLGLVAAGLCMYGLFSLAEARYRRL